METARQIPMETGDAGPGPPAHSSYVQVVKQT